MRFSKQVSQIVQLTDKFNDDGLYPVGVAMDGVWLYARDTASGFEFGLGPDPSLVQSHDVGHELPDTTVSTVLAEVPAVKFTFICVGILSRICHFRI